MMRINKLTDYGIVVMTEMATSNMNKIHTARGISESTNIPLPTVTRLLKTLSSNDLLDSQRGSQGGYNLAKPSDKISIANIIEIFEGPISLTECSTNSCECSYESNCSVEEPWQKINDTVKNALESISLNEMAGNSNNENLIGLSISYGGQT